MQPRCGQLPGQRLRTVYARCLWRGEEYFYISETTKQKQILKYKKDYIYALITHFIECIGNPSDYIQFEDIDQFVKFAHCVISINSDIAINQQLISFLLNLSIKYNRWPSMNGIACMLNILISKDPEHYRLFVFNQKSQLKEIALHLDSNNKFNEIITRLIAS